MLLQQTYFMHDQVKNLVPDIMENDTDTHTKQLTGINHLAIFAFFAGSYLLSIALGA